MKKFVQNTGVRKWYGDEWVAIQDEANAVIEGFFGHYNTPFILSGCEVNGSNIAAGIVGLIHADGFKLCRFAGALGVTFPVYLKPVKTEETRTYLDGATKPVACTYSAELSEIAGSGYLEVMSDGSTSRFNDIVQDASHRMVSDVEKANYAGQADSAVTVIRDGVDAAQNTLKKLKEYIDTYYPDPIDVEALKTELRGNVIETLNTMEEIVDYIESLDYLPVFSGSSELSGAIIDWNGTPELYKVLTANVTLDASNLIVGKTIGLRVSGSFSTTFSSKFKKVVGSPDPLAGSNNYIQMKCLDDTSGSESIMYLVFYLP